MRAQNEADKAAGKPPRACTPPHRKAHLDPVTLLAEFDAPRRTQKQMSVDVASFDVMDRHIPCK